MRGAAGEAAVRGAAGEAAVRGAVVSSARGGVARLDVDGRGIFDGDIVVREDGVSIRSGVGVDRVGSVGAFHGRALSRAGAGGTYCLGG